VCAAQRWILVCHGSESVRTWERGEGSGDLGVLFVHFASSLPIVFFNFAFLAFLWLRDSPIQGLGNYRWGRFPGPTLRSSPGYNILGLQPVKVWLHPVFGLSSSHERDRDH
jgi:hypothetical protein